ncbi:tRNA (uracil-5-)-methyltransferase homolog A-like, partial [Petromyzon marinus]|uniref:tRNA (uracil-5-)-methyltransferase homolog A-like n=1 Tax=Petromyzon marinus TaxID=7757 RepID=UPI003F6F1158
PRDICANNRALQPWVLNQREKFDHLCCPFQGITPSPLQTLVRQSKYDVYDPHTYRGHWRQLTVRTSRCNELMAILTFHPQELSEQEVAAVKQEVVHFFTAEDSGKACGVTSLYFLLQGQRERVESPPELLWGSARIKETLMGLSFLISPSSFFQVNTGGAEALLTLLGEWAGLTPDTHLLDVCCGTGTIGLSLARFVKSVVGVDICAEAIEDANMNAALNGVTNARFVCARAEDSLSALVSSMRDHPVVAIVDPPRAGLQVKVLQAVRRALCVGRILYVSCNPRSAAGNFNDLCRAPSNRMRGPPFRPIRAAAVDLFPHTPHYELLLLFERATGGAGGGQGGGG